MQKYFTAIFIGFLVVLPIKTAQAANALEEQVEVLEARVQALENYIDKLPSTMKDFSKSVTNNMDMRVKEATSDVILLNPVSNKFSKIETNVGTFLISVNRMEKTDKGYLLYLFVGNPYAIKYTGAKIRLLWGKKWDPSYAKISFEGWRQSLTGAQYSFDGALDPGKWTEIAVDLSPVESLEYVECEMSVATAMLTQ